MEDNKTSDDALSDATNGSRIELVSLGIESKHSRKLITKIAIMSDRQIELINPLAKRRAITILTTYLAMNENATDIKKRIPKQKMQCYKDID